MQSNKPFHYNFPYAGTTQLWSGVDSEASFYNPQNQSRLQQLGWIDKPVSYTYNAQGFRSSEFDDRPCGLAFGCSFTEGTGVPVEAAWPSQLSQLLNLHVWNFGVGGAAVDTVFRLMDHYLDQFSPNFVTLLIPPKGRVEILSDQHYKVCFRNRADHNAPYESYSRAFFSQESNLILHVKRNLLAMQQLCQDRNIPFYWLDSNDYITAGGQDLARDLDHPGPAVLEQVARAMYNKIIK
jgi:hypothetical protein